MSSNEHVLAIDCDLRRVHAWSSEVGRVAYKDKSAVDIVEWVNANRPDRVLYEIAGPAYPAKERPGVIRNYARWAIFNAGTAGVVQTALCQPLLVATSAVWTRRYEEGVRQRLAKADAPNHDLRECQAMIFFYRARPQDWVPYFDYMNGL